MKYLKHIKFSIFSIIIVVLMYIVYSLKQNNQKIDCAVFMEKFDNYITNSLLPIMENPNSLCYNLNFGSDFTKLNPKRAVGKIVIEKNTFIFKWINKTWSIDQLWKNYWSIDNGNEEKYYKVDMNNLCRWFFSLVDSQYPSKRNRGWIQPREVRCK